MLKIVNEIDCEKVALEMDEYIHFNVEFGENDLFSPLYWRGGDGSLSLIEIGISEKEKKVRSITLTSVNKEKVIETEKNILSQLPETKGMVVCNTNCWFRTENFESNFKDELIEFHILLGDNYLSLIFESSEQIIRYVTNEKIRFGISENNAILSIDILDLSRKQIEIFRESIQ